MLFRGLHSLPLSWDKNSLDNDIINAWVIKIIHVLGKLGKRLFRDNQVKIVQHGKKSPAGIRKTRQGNRCRLVRGHRQHFFYALDPEEVKIRLEEMARKHFYFCKMICFPFNKARLIGAELVNLHFDQPDSLNVSIQVLKEHLIDRQPPKRKLPPNIPSLFEGITFGFVEQSQKSNRSENESVLETMAPLKNDYGVAQDQPESPIKPLLAHKQRRGEQRKKIATLRDNEDQFQVLFDESPLPMTLFRHVTVVSLPGKITPVRGK